MSANSYVHVCIACSKCGECVSECEHKPTYEVTTSTSAEQIYVVTAENEIGHPTHSKPLKAEE